jgi:hypothetical protein
MKGVLGVPGLPSPPIVRQRFLSYDTKLDTSVRSQLFRNIKILLPVGHKSTLSDLEGLLPIHLVFRLGSKTILICWMIYLPLEVSDIVWAWVASCCRR